jgi:hypothetical protein
MPKLQLSYLVDLEGTAAWRWRVVEEYPEDPRNRRVAEILDQLASEVAALNGSPLHLRLETFLDVEMLGQEISEMLRAIGFRYFPQSAPQLIEDIITILEHRYR